MVDQRFTSSVYILTVLAFHEKSSDDLVTSDWLAQGSKSNPAAVRRLVSRLVEGGLILSFKGKNGGLKLAKSPREITLYDVYRHSCGKPLFGPSDKSPVKHCPVSCSMKKLMEEVTDGVEEATAGYLSKIRLSDLVSKVKD